MRVTDTGIDTANSIPSGSITSDMIADGTVIAADVADGTVTNEKLDTPVINPFLLSGM